MSALKSLGPNQSLVLIAILQTFLIISVIFDIAVFRQIIGFVYLTFVPGLLVLKILNLNVNFAEKIFFSITLSVAMLMIIGLLMDLIGPIVGILNPLSEISILITFSMVVPSLCFMAYFKQESRNTVQESNRLPHFSMKLLSILIVLPLLGVLGSFLVILYNNSLLLLGSIFAVALVIIGVTFFRQAFPKKSYPLLILIISITLLAFVNSSLVTNNIVGWDVHSEYYAFQITNTNQAWSSSYILGSESVQKGFASLSVTILPTVYAQILHMDSSWLFKLFYSIITAFVSLGVFLLFKTQLKALPAFFAAFFFMVISMSYGWGSDKQIIGQLFYVALFLVIFKNTSALQKSILFILFGFSLVVSHYSLAYIFLVSILILLVVTMAFRKRPKISISLVILFLVITFLWYVFVINGVAFTSLVDNMSDIVRNFLTDFFNPNARGQEVLSGIGITSASSPLHLVGRWFFYLAEFLVIVGFVFCILKIMGKLKRPKISFEYSLLIIFNTMLLVGGILIPNLANSFRMERFFQTAMLLAAPALILGWTGLFGRLTKIIKGNKKNLKKTGVAAFAIIIIAPNFLFNIGFIYEVTGDQSWSAPLSWHRLKGDISGYNVYSITVTDQDLNGAQWLSRNSNTRGISVYGDYTSIEHVLLSYGMQETWRYLALLNSTTRFYSGAFVYLRQENTVFDSIFSINIDWNTSQIKPLLDEQDMVYSNGYTDIYYTLPVS